FNTNDILVPPNEIHTDTRRVSSIYARVGAHATFLLPPGLQLVRLNTAAGSYLRRQIAGLSSIKSDQMSVVTTGGDSGIFLCFGALAAFLDNPLAARRVTIRESSPELSGQY